MNTRRRSRARAVRLALAGVCCGLGPWGVGGCAAPPRSTRLTTQDLREVAIEMAVKLRGAPFLAGRGPESERVVIGVSNVDNLTTDLLTEGEKWYLMDRVVDSDSIGALGREKNVRFVIPAEKLRLLNKTLPVDEEAGRVRRPTHAMTAALRSLTRASGKHRTDLYSCEFRITELESGELVWSDSFELKRVGEGSSYN